MRPKIRGPILLALLILACEARTDQAGEPDWQYARFGMTPIEVQAASQGVAVEAVVADQNADRSRDATVRLKAPLRWEDSTFTVFFAFEGSPERLASVTLQLERYDPGAYSRLSGILTSLYGTPDGEVGQEDVRLRTWQHAGRSIGLMELSNPATAVGAPMVSINYQATQ